MGNEEVPTSLPESRVFETFEPDCMPQRDEGFKKTWNFFFPPHEVCITNQDVGLDERTLALMCKRALDMDVPEAMASIIARAESESWEYYQDMTRQLRDEARHATMGSIYFEHHGIPWRERIPLHMAFSLHLNLAISAQEAHIILYAIEQMLMPAKTGKRFEWETAVAANNVLASLFQDYDWADEVLHAKIGRRWLLPRLTTDVNETMAYGKKLMESIPDTMAKYQYLGEQEHWWPDFVRGTLGHDSGMKEYLDRKLYEPGA